MSTWEKITRFWKIENLPTSLSDKVNASITKSPALSRSDKPLINRAKYCELKDLTNSISVEKFCKVKANTKC